ncbi:uncharacterized protein PHALS_03050 [Plasmopara halstedii]|uniref:Uncharacterized protein n=1 Tax=Plasmopara halstedii TaxID=4781 RepID=A0A0P1A7A4_PLAHL|nr:uncharacterized protein PHALS_03050 [Plasmopara halstedii]CEG36502.1 hypothetical protein PHALS_03050 [Plasmopara halstedii]|eukprot:XP_024572871.1 hypothetical protein PHALS_03050 [Plasmopara halstedii]
MYDWDLLYRDRPGASLPSFFLSDEKRIEPPSAFQSQDGLVLQAKEMSKVIDSKTLQKFKHSPEHPS